MDEWVRVPIGDGVAVKVRRTTSKRRHGNEDKMQSPAGNKDDFTVIAGVGRKTAQRLYAAGISTFAMLRVADVGFLGSRARKAIAEWKCAA